MPRDTGQGNNKASCVIVHCNTHLAEEVVRLSIRDHMDDHLPTSSAHMVIQTLYLAHLVFLNNPQGDSGLGEVGKVPLRPKGDQLLTRITHSLANRLKC